MCPIPWAPWDSVLPSAAAAALRKVTEPSPSSRLCYYHHINTDSCVFCDIFDVINKSLETAYDDNWGYLLFGYNIQSMHDLFVNWNLVTLFFKNAHVKQSFLFILVLDDKFKCKNIFFCQKKNTENFVFYFCLIVFIFSWKITETFGYWQISNETIKPHKSKLAVKKDKREMQIHVKHIRGSRGRVSSITNNNCAYIWHFLVTTKLIIISLMMKIELCVLVVLLYILLATAIQ